MTLENFLDFAKGLVGRNRGLQKRDFRTLHVSQLNGEFEGWIECKRATKMNGAIFRVSYSSELNDWAVSQYNRSPFEIRN